MTNPDDINPDRLRAIIASAVAGLTPQDRASREAWCIENDSHGVRMFPSYDREDLIELRWGNRQLALIPIDILSGEQPITGQFIPDDDAMDAEIADLLDNEGGDHAQ